MRRIVCARERKIPASPGALPRDWAAYEAAEDVAGPALDGVVAHAGFLFMAERLLDDLAPFLDVAEGHRVVLAGHSIGGALATLLTVLLATRDDDRFLFDGENLEAFTFAALPCLRVVEGERGLQDPQHRADVERRAPRRLVRRRCAPALIARGSRQDARTLRCGRDGRSMRRARSPPETSAIP